MPKKKKVLKKLERRTVRQEKEKNYLEDSEEITGKKLDKVAAPGVDFEDELKKKWKYQELGREVEEKNPDEESDIDEEEEAGEEPYPEIEESIKEDADEEEEEE
jgi:hypothetical protein